MAVHSFSIEGQYIDINFKWNCLKTLLSQAPRNQFSDDDDDGGGDDNDSDDDEEEEEESQKEYLFWKVCFQQKVAEQITYCKLKSLLLLH